MIGSEFIVGELKSLSAGLDRLVECIEWEERQRKVREKEVEEQMKKAEAAKAEALSGEAGPPVSSTPTVLTVLSGIGARFPGGRENWEFLARKSDNLFKAVLDKSAERSL